MPYALTIALSSFLLFAIQPILAKAILPRFGGSAGVWLTSMLFFQVTLLAGYLYSYVITRVPRRVQQVIHLALLAASLLALPIHPHFESMHVAAEAPSLGILGLLAVSVGLPFLLLSSTSPLLQSWSATQGVRFPYRLFALSNAASLLALFGYPFAIEPLFTAKHQMEYWSAAYVAFVLLAAFSTLRSAGEIRDEAPAPFPDTPHRPLLWIALSACASALWLAVANHLSQQVAPIPFLWVLPLGLYLLSFILCFVGRDWYRPYLYRWLLPAAWIAIGARLALEGSAGGIEWEIPILSAALFICCMFCHGELADSKPDARHGLTFFYLMVALGGALGGVFVSLVAPNLFTTYLELPIGVTACVLLALALLFNFPPKRLLRLALFATLAFIFALRYRGGDADVVHIRNFYGALQVRDRLLGGDAARALYNGITLHGVQFLSPERRRLATAFFSNESGVGRLLDSRHEPNRQVAIVGLGAGTIATYGHSGDHFRFFDINPAVAFVAINDFHFLSDSAAKIDVVIADGRIALEHESPASLDVIVLDAFADDTIPIHLLTREAIAADFQRLRPHGAVAVHITNRYLDLEPLLRSLAASLGKQCLIIHNLADPDRAISEADWAILSDDPLLELTTFSDAPSTKRRPPPWTDDFSNIFRSLR